MQVLGIRTRGLIGRPAKARRYTDRKLQKTLLPNGLGNSDVSPKRGRTLRRSLDIWCKKEVSLGHLQSSLF